MSTGFKASEIILVFNEYISLKNASSQITFSPPLNEKPKILARGKELSLSWEEQLKDSTTYTISFGSAITDFTEGNANKSLKFVFSTGSFIDSLTLRGSVRDGLTGEAEAEILVALYDIDTLESYDSIAFNGFPSYYTITAEDGSFHIENIKNL